jgi:hypothetical protein
MVRVGVEGRRRREKMAGRAPALVL